MYIPIHIVTNSNVISHASTTMDTEMAGKKVVSALAIDITEENNNDYIQTGGANTQIIVDGADADSSFVTRSTVPWNIAVPLTAQEICTNSCRCQSRISF